jgi:hypothetical protein
MTGVDDIKAATTGRPLRLQFLSLKNAGLFDRVKFAALAKLMARPPACQAPVFRAHFPSETVAASESRLQEPFEDNHCRGAQS